MVKTGKKPVIGITGGICSGKSTVASLLGRLGCKVIDADEIAHKMLEKNEIKKKVVNRFGQGILTPAGKISRRKLAEIVFRNKAELSKLTGILHPPVLVQIKGLIKKYNRQNAIKAIVLDMPLLAEAGWEKRCDYVIFVDCRQALRVKRAEKTGLFNENGLKIRENFQFSLDKKVKIADNAVDNNNGVSSLKKQVKKIFTKIVN